MIGLESWFSNFTQFSRKWITAESLADVPRPHVEYAIWSTFKAAELMSVLGGLLAHPIYRFYLWKQLTPEMTTPNSHKIIRSKCRRLQGRFLLVGLFSAPLLSRLQTLQSGTTAAELQNKCYAIRCDGHGLTIDRCALVCGLVGWYWRRFQGAVDGINIGLAYALFSTKVLEPRTSPMLRDHIHPDLRYNSVEAASENKSKLIKFFAEQDRKNSQ
ncbi:unnamed protein product [Caenorhabditis auriculariae]|uniref:Uncharacterized protein n=1 Tax=Caenorhabditis auriculariae TaxID=2777116 RepID=A0A8S1H091_9PELO|nr:unnamed protein product [Caenorhabditis auriculariae]